MAVFSFFHLATMLFLGSGFGLPLGIPPADEDPVVSRAAPEECLFYLGWAGMAKPDPASTNQTEQLLAEQEVQECVARIETAILQSMHRNQGPDKESAAVVDSLATVLKTAITSPAAIFATKFDPAAGERGLQGGAIVNVGAKATEVEEAMVALEKTMAGPADAKPGKDAKGWRRFPLGHGEVALQWAVKGKYLVVGLGDGEAEKIIGRAKQAPPAWLIEARRQVAVARPANLMYVNVAGLVKAGQPVIDAHVRRTIDALGLDRVQSLVSGTGLDESGCVTKTQLNVDGDLTGLLSVFTGAGLSKEHLAAIPKDATLAGAARLDLAATYKELLEVAGRIDPGMRREVNGAVDGFEEAFKVKLSQDIFESLGDVWRVYNSPSEGGLILTGLTGVVSLRDRDRLVMANAKLVVGSLFDAARHMTEGPGSRRGPRVTQSKFGQHTIFCLTSTGDFMPFAPAWCITDKELVVALFPQNVRAYLQRSSSAASLADVPEAAAVFADGKGPMAMTYYDTRELFKLIYPVVQMFVQVASREFQREGVNLDITALPSAPSIARHLRPAVTAVRRNKAGVLIESRQTFPMSGGGLMPAFWLAPVSRYQARPMSTPRVSSMNNLKQLMLALHMYHDSRARFPASAGPKPPGKQPVSWRVLILPFVERNELYQQYRFDEPWDSPNNQKLLARMPETFKAPGSRVAAQGKTNYLAVVGKDYALAATEGRRLMDFADGTSNTIMLVEVSDQQAVPWTKPEDFTPDKTKSLDGLLPLRPGTFLAAYADGHVESVSTTLSAAQIHAKFTRDGGDR